MKLAFLISAHTNPEHLKRLILSLPEDAVFVVHIDAKSDISAFTSIINDNRVHFIENRTNVMWGSIGHVDNQMKMIRKALELCKDTPFDYFIMLSGLDYPLWSNERILSFFAENNGKEFIATQCMENQGKEAKIYTEHRPFNYKYWPYGSLGSKFRVALRHIIYGIGIRKKLRFVAKGREYVLHKGSMNWAITPDLAKLALDYWDNNPEYVRYFHDGHGPDETFIQTLTAHSEFADKAIRITGPFLGLESITPLHYMDYTEGTKVLTEKDFDILIESGKMFCRKTVTGQSDRLMDMIDRHRRA